MEHTQSVLFGFVLLLLLNSGTLGTGSASLPPARYKQQSCWSFSIYLDSVYCRVGTWAPMLCGHMFDPRCEQARKAHVAATMVLVPCDIVLYSYHESGVFSDFFHRCLRMLVLLCLAWRLWSANDFFACCWFKEMKPHHFLVFFHPSFCSTSRPTQQIGWAERTFPFEISNMFPQCWLGCDRGGLPSLGFFSS